MVTQGSTWCFYWINYDTGQGVIEGPDEASVRRFATRLGATAGDVTECERVFTLQITLSAKDPPDVYG